MSDDGLVFIKWGGSLITDKQSRATARPEVIERLARELAALSARWPGRVVLGHGSGSFGHFAAREHGVAEGVRAGGRLEGIGRTQLEAARLHRLVTEKLLDSGVPVFSVTPGSVVVTAAGRAPRTTWAPVWRALDLGLVPVVYGDVVLDDERGCAILSTERVFVELAADLAATGGGPLRIFWLGETDGVWDPDGRTMARVEPRDLELLSDAIGGSAGTDVTGGMRHRLEGAFELAALGAESWILDGREERVVERALAGEELGTRVGGGG